MSDSASKVVSSSSVSSSFNIAERNEGMEPTANISEPESMEEEQESNECILFLEKEEVLDRLRFIASPSTFALFEEMKDTKNNDKEMDTSKEGEVLDQKNSHRSNELGKERNIELAEQGVDWITKILEKYQEQATLLDPSLEEMLSIVMGRARDIMIYRASKLQLSKTVMKDQDMIEKEDEGKVSGEKTDTIDHFYKRQDQQLHFLFQLVYTLCRLRGAKTVTKFFSHEASDLEPVLYLLKSQDQKDFSTWQTRYGLLLWMSMLALVPFDICSIDTSLGGITLSGETTKEEMKEAETTLVSSILNISKGYLSDAGPTRVAAATCLASILKRPDMEATHLHNFLDWCSTCLSIRVENMSGSSQDDGVGGKHISFQKNHMDSSSETNNTTSTTRTISKPEVTVFLVSGILQTLANLYKAGHRSKLLQFTPMIFPSLLALNKDPNNQTLLRKLITKLFQRIGLVFLPPRLAKWRYQRGQRSLLDNLNNAHSSRNDTLSEMKADFKDDQDGEEGKESKRNEKKEQDDNEEEEDENDDEELEVTEELEEVVEVLLSGLRDKDTVVRWSAAKGIGRVTSVLTKGLADEIVVSVLQLFSDGEGENSWHGGCLALAELARRCLLLPSRLPTVVPLVVRALGYDVRRGYTSVGVHVRDAACYVAWAFARAYSPSVMAPHVRSLATAMLTTALFDREINCRRAASAAFQENVGRQGHQNFPHGIDILTAADYFTLGNRTNAYTSICTYVCGFEIYQFPLMNHLWKTKLNHWDVNIRRLAAKALNKLCASYANVAKYAIDVVIPELLPLITSQDLSTRHGAILGLAEILLGISEGMYESIEKEKIIHYFSQQEDLKTQYVDIIIIVEKARLYRGRGGHLVRSGICRLIECISLSNLITISNKLQIRLLDSLDECAGNPLDEVQDAAVNGVYAFSRTYLTVNPLTGPSPRLYARVVGKYLDLLKTTDNVAISRGFTRFLGALPKKLLGYNEYLPALLDVLADLARTERKIGEDVDAETRKNAINSIVDIVNTVGMGTNIYKEESKDEQCDNDTSKLEDETTNKNYIRGFSVHEVERIYRTLFESVKDYSMDQRGDVGSWCRIAGLKGLYTVSKIAIDSSPIYSEKMQVEGTKLSDQEEYESTTVICSGVERETMMKSLLDNRPTEVSNQLEDLAASKSTFFDNECKYFSDKVAHKLIEALLKQLSEKLDAVREAAGTILEQILTSNQPYFPCIYNRYQLQATMNIGKVSINWASPTETFPLIVQFLELDNYHTCVLEGLIISVGGLTESVVKASSTAFLNWLQECNQNKKIQNVVQVSRSLVKMFDTYHGTDRVIIPLLKTINICLKNPVFVLNANQPSQDISSDSESSSPFVEEMKNFALGLHAAAKEEIVGCTDIRKLLTIVELLSLLVDKPDPIQELVLTTSMILLGHKYPRVRKAMAEALYLICMELQSEFEDRMGADTYDALLAKVSDVVWDMENTTYARDQRDEVAALLGVKPPERKLISGAKGSEKKQNKKDGLDSYAALVKDVGY